MKISKTTWAMMVIGVLIIGGISLGMALSQQTAQKDNLEKELTLAKQKLITLDNEKLMAQKEQLALRINEYAAETKNIKSKLTFSDDNINITDALIQNALDRNVKLLEINSAGRAIESMGGIKYETMNMSVKAQGTNETIAEFVYSLKNIFPTCIVMSVNLNISEPPANPDSPTPVNAGDNYTALRTTQSDSMGEPVKITIVNINFVIYNYKGE